jgi:hypothetical protein
MVARSFFRESQFSRDELYAATMHLVGQSTIFTLTGARRFDDNGGQSALSLPRLARARREII